MLTYADVCFGVQRGVHSGAISGNRLQAWHARHRQPEFRQNWTAYAGAYEALSYLRPHTRV
jgi:hypothetical protein